MNIRILTSILAWAISLLLCSGCVAIYNDGGFKWDGHNVTDYSSPINDDPSIKVVDDWRSFYIPWILHVHTSKGKPYPIEIKFVDKSKTIGQLYVDKVTIYYEDVDKPEIISVKITFPLKEEEMMYFLGNAKWDYASVRLMQSYLPVKIEQDKSFHITVDGVFHKLDGSEQSFKFTEFKKFAPDFRITPVWDEMP